MFFFLSFTPSLFLALPLGNLLRAEDADMTAKEATPFGPPTSNLWLFWGAQYRFRRQVPLLGLQHGRVHCLLARRKPSKGMVLIYG